MGRAQDRRPRHVREAGAGRLPGRPVVAHHPQEAGELPQSFPRLRCRAHRPLRRQGHCAADGRPRHRAQQAEGGGHHRQRTGTSQAAGAHRARGVPVELRRRPSADQHASVLQERACRDADVQSHLQGAQGRGLPLRRAHHRLCLHAGHRHGQRPPDELPSLRAVRKAAAILQGRPRRGRAHDGQFCPRHAEAGRIARLAAHAVGPAPRPARSIARRHRDRRHRPRAGPGCALERPDGRRSRLLGGAARAGRGADRGRAASPTRSPAGCWPRCCTMHPST